MEERMAEVYHAPRGVMAQRRWMIGGEVRVSQHESRGRFGRSGFFGRGHFDGVGFFDGPRLKNRRAPQAKSAPFDFLSPIRRIRTIDW